MAIKKLVIYEMDVMLQKQTNKIKKAMLFKIN